MNIGLPERTARFRADLAALAGPAPAAFGVAVSGGPDSLALLLLAEAAFPGGFQAATVDHGLRPENAREAQDVAALCRRLAVPHAVLPVELVVRRSTRRPKRRSRKAARTG